MDFRSIIAEKEKEAKPCFLSGEIFWFHAIDSVHQQRFS